jgi:hypothetical protein
MSFVVMPSPQWPLLPVGRLLKGHLRAVRDYFKTGKLDYHDGEKYPLLERDASKPDLLSEILKPRTQAP